MPTPDSEDQSYSLPNPESAGDPRYFPDMVAYMDKNLGRLMQALDDLDIADNTVLVFMADNGTDRSLSNLYENGVTIPGGKGTMTDRGTRVPLIVRWPGRIVAGSTCDDLVDFSDFFPTLCALADAPLPEDLLHGRSFLPQLLGTPGDPRAWIHVQDQEQRHVRNRDFILNNADELRPTVEIWQSRAATVPTPYSPGEQGAYDALRRYSTRWGIEAAKKPAPAWAIDRWTGPLTAGRGWTNAVPAPRTAGWNGVQFRKVGSIAPIRSLCRCPI